jgi:predicted O-linked N-acetylglucosamine transferase (SPINDLY family)
LGALLRKTGELDEARQALHKATDLAPEDAGAWTLLGQLEASTGNDKLAQNHFQHALKLDNDAADAQQGMADILFRSDDNEVALTYADHVLEKKPNDVAALSRKAQVLTRLRRFEEAAVICDKLIEQDTRNGSTHWNDLGNIKRDLGDLKEAEACYRKGASLTTSDPVPLSNRLTLLHYMPDQTAEDILQACKEWSARFAPAKAGKRPIPPDLSPARRLRVGMYSDGFRQHPVGAMTTPALEHLARLGIDIYAYTTNNVVDSVTRRLMKVAKQWTPIATMSVEQLAQRVMDDQIDILIDLSGHNAGNRIRTMTLQPAPVQVKWVGGLINTTGVEAIDYLLSDAIESPPGTDHFYTEKLIRMPDDYICYMPPARVPEVGPLPALRNGYVTFGCFNNPTKINEVLLAEWARLLAAVPDSRLFLKGGSYESTEVCERIFGIFAGHGIEGDRIRLEGHSPHYEVFERYNEVDVALDPWPYSGGLTTCEAMLMGVPVVTLPGPTFAGRHSATHLVNTGMPELVVKDWDEYRQRALELVGDLNSLSTIRAHLRQILLQSPVCDGPRFARNLANAFRAIWQRYCAGKTPAALSFTEDGQAWFDGDDTPMVLLHPASAPANEDDSFSFAFQGKIVALDHGGSLANSPKLRALSRLEALETAVIDPSGHVKDAERLKLNGLVQHYHPHVVLGDGEPALLYACLDAELSGTLEPLPIAEQRPFERQSARVLAKLPVSTIRLDAVDGLQRIDWLLLSGSYDNIKLLQGAERLLSGVLILQAMVYFKDIYANQADLGALKRTLRLHGFRLLQLNEAKYRSHFPVLPSTEHFGGSELVSAEAVFIPDDQRLNMLDDNQCRKLAFLLHAAYGASDLAHRILGLVDQDAAGRFLHGVTNFVEEGKCPEQPTSTASKQALQRRQTSLLAGVAQHADMSLPNVTSLREADDIVRFVRTLQSGSATARDAAVQRCEGALARDSGNNTAHFVLVHALLAKGAMADPTISPELSELNERLKTIGWTGKGSLYEYWLSAVRLRSRQRQPKISAILIANRFKNDILENVAELRAQHEDIQIVFVNNGVPVGEFSTLSSMVDTWIDLKGNSGAYVARNIGAIYAEAPILLFVDDDGFPEDGFVQGHLATHLQFKPVSLRGACRPKSKNSETPAHYNLGDNVRSAPPLLEGNASFNRDAFLAVGGWGDYILFGHGGVDISHRLNRNGFPPDRQMYTPHAVLLHDYVRGKAHATEKFAKQRASWFLVEALRNANSAQVRRLAPVTNQPTLHVEGKSKIASTSATPYVIQDRPAMEAAAIDLLHQHLSKTRHYMEYGSGGSTLFAGSSGVSSIVSVDSDQVFLEAVVDAFEKRIGSGVTLKSLYADIGPTGAWGKPTGFSNALQWPRYCTMPWEYLRSSNAPRPDLILIDGRFRRASFLISLLLAETGCSILWDDYTDRGHYHSVEEFLKPQKTAGRLVEFVVPEQRDTTGIILQLVQASTDSR